jgi:hypothetical protein
MFEPSHRKLPQMTVKPIIKELFPYQHDYLIPISWKSYEGVGAGNENNKNNNKKLSYFVDRRHMKDPLIVVIIIFFTLISIARNTILYILVC